MRRNGEHGFTTIQYVVATGFSLLLFVLVANLLVDLYERGAVRDALDEGVRAGVPAAATAHDWFRIGWMFEARDTVGVGGFLQLLPPPPPPPPPPSLEPPPAHAESPQSASRSRAVAAERIRAKAGVADRLSVRFRARP